MLDTTAQQGRIFLRANFDSARSLIRITCYCPEENTTLLLKNYKIAPATFQQLIANLASILSTVPAETKIELVCNAMVYRVRDAAKCRYVHYDEATSRSSYKDLTVKLLIDSPELRACKGNLRDLVLRDQRIKSARCGGNEEVVAADFECWFGVDINQAIRNNGYKIRFEKILARIAANDPTLTEVDFEKDVGYENDRFWNYSSIIDLVAFAKALETNTNLTSLNIRTLSGDAYYSGDETELFMIVFINDFCKQIPKKLSTEAGAHTHDILSQIQIFYYEIRGGCANGFLIFNSEFINGKFRRFINNNLLGLLEDKSISLEYAKSWFEMIRKLLDLIDKRLHTSFDLLEQIFPQYIAKLISLQNQEVPFANFDAALAAVEQEAGKIRINTKIIYHDIYVAYLKEISGLIDAGITCNKRSLVIELLDKTEQLLVRAHKDDVLSITLIPFISFSHSICSNLSVTLPVIEKLLLLTEKFNRLSSEKYKKELSALFEEITSIYVSKFSYVILKEREVKIAVKHCYYLSGFLKDVERKGYANFDKISAKCYETFLKVIEKHLHQKESLKDLLDILQSIPVSIANEERIKDLTFKIAKSYVQQKLAAIIDADCKFLARQTSKLPAALENLQVRIKRTEKILDLIEIYKNFITEALPEQISVLGGAIYWRKTIEALQDINVWLQKFASYDESKSLASSASPMLQVLPSAPPMSVKKYPISFFSGLTSDATDATPIGKLLIQCEREGVQLADDEVPKEFICPVSQMIMKDPVLALDGFQYDRSKIESWFAKNQTSPMTGLDIGVTLTPVVEKQGLIIEFLEGLLKQNKPHMVSKIDYKLFGKTVSVDPVIVRSANVENKFG